MNLTASFTVIRIGQVSIIAEPSTIAIAVNRMSYIVVSVVLTGAVSLWFFIRHREFSAGKAAHARALAAKRAKIANRATAESEPKQTRKPRRFGRR